MPIVLVVLATLFFQIWLLATWFGFDLKLAVLDSLATVSAIVISVAVLGAVLSRYTPTRDKFLFAGLVAIALSVVLFQHTYPAFE
ncbi:MAG: hypothetical protein ACK5YT_08005 [Bacteroidota bacterium]